VTWLIRLYPPRWRRRYGRELADLIAAQPASFSTAVDLVAGAIDAWVNPQLSTAAAAADAKGERAMLAKMLQLKCAGHGAHVSRRDELKAATVVIGGALVLTAIYLWATARYESNPYLDALASLGWLVPVLFSQHFTTLKGRSARVQAVFIGGQSAVIIGIGLAAAWISAR
jgi:hypothetical protein